MTLDDALATVRAHSDLTEREWSELEQSVKRRRFGLPATRATVPEPYIEPLTREFTSAWLSQADIARVLHADSALIRVWNARGKLPKPDDHVGTRPVWSRATVEWFARELELLAK